jgi:hypothetical protein
MKQRRQQSQVKKFDGFDLLKSVDFRFLQSASRAHQQAACHYEYMRESQVLRHAIAAPAKKGCGLASLALSHQLTFSQLGRLLLTLRQAGFPKPWKQLTKDSKDRIVPLLAEWRKEAMWGNKSAGIPPDYPPLVIEGVHSDSLATDHNLPYSWLENAPEPTLFQTWGDRKYFKGFIRLDEDCNETEVVAALRVWFRDRYGKTKGGGGPKWRQRLNQLAVMRIWNHEPNQWKRLQLVAKVCGYKACAKEAEAYKERRPQGRADEPMSGIAKVEMSSARTEARAYFQRLFPGQEPLSYSRPRARQEG